MVAEPLEKNLYWREGRDCWSQNEGSCWHEVLSWVWRHILCMGAACVCLLLCLCMPPWSLKAQCRRLNSSSFPKSAPAPERPILTNDGSVFAFCISQNPQHHAFLIFLLHPVSDQSPGSVNSVSLISLTTNSPHSTPTALVGVNALPARLCAYWATLRSLRKLHLSPSPGFYAYLSSVQNPPSPLLPVFN